MTTDDTPSIRQLLKRAKKSSPDVAGLDPESVPESPMDLFVDWLETAVEGGVTEPQAMTLSTVDHAGTVSARTLLLKDVDDAFWFASSSLSPKGRQIRENPRVALTLYWREQGRQVRILGDAGPGPRETSVADFTARHPDSRAVAIAMPQSTPVDDDEKAKQALDAAKARIADDDDFAPDDWTAFRVVPTCIEFWQATTGRDQVRVRYDRSAPTTWTRSRLWP